MRRVSQNIVGQIKRGKGQKLDAHYRGFLRCFNNQRFYEAHKVLEELWRAERWGRDGPFYKGLIQLAGAFVHLQKGRLQPAAALLKLARTNLEGYRPFHQGLGVDDVLEITKAWLRAVEAGSCQPTGQGAAQGPWLKLSR